MSTATVSAPCLTALVQDFLTRHLPLERNASPNTVLSYRDALKLLLRFLSSSEERSPDTLTFEDVLDAERVRAFLRWLIQERRCKPATCNQRLAALKSFAGYVAARAPEQLDRCRQVRELPRAQTEEKEVEYLDSDETARLLQAPDVDRVAGARDRALLLLLYNTGARVQEVCSLDVKHIRLDEVPCVRLLGKGRKERVCPLWKKTVTALETWLQHRQPTGDEAPLFLNANGRRLSRSGVAHVLSRAAAKARLGALRHARRATPHVIRHTTAMHLLQVGADLSTIASWLGHADISTTHSYVAIDLRMKQEAVAASTLLPELRAGTFPAPDVVAWLEQLGRRPRYVDSSPPKPPSPPDLRQRCA